MHLTPKDEDRLLLFLAAELARKRQAKGLRLTYPEARAIIADEVVEAARAGASVAEATEIGAQLLSEDDVLPGVADLIGTVQVEGFFEDGQKLVTIHDPIRPGTDVAAAEFDDFDNRRAGEVLTGEGTIELNAGRATRTLTVINTGDRPVQVGSHFHFFETNRALLFDRRAAFGMRLDVPSGTAVRFEAGAEREVQLVALGGSREVYGLNEMTEGPLTGDTREIAMSTLRDSGFLDSADRS